MKIHSDYRPAIDMFRPLFCKILLAGSAILVVLPATAFAQKSSTSTKAREAKFSKLEAKVGELETDYYQTCETAKAQLIDRMGKFINYCEDMPGLAVDVRLNILQELREARTAIEKRNSFTAIPAFQGIYLEFAKAIASKYWPLTGELDKLRSALSTGDARRDDVDKRILKLSEHYTSFDSLKVGSQWTGYRCDFKMPARFEIDPAKIGQAGMFRKVQDNPVNIDFGLRIEKRTGSKFSGVASQEGGRFQANVEGVYDGVNLKMWMVSMKKGAERRFEYAGQLVGGCGCLQMQGLKVNKAFTVGTIYMTLK